MYLSLSLSLCIYIYIYTQLYDARLFGVSAQPLQSVSGMGIQKVSVTWIPFGDHPMKWERYRED